ncbi:MAG TPA: L,D-transpeptidase [Chthoniobacterales bacterium]|nr:L,D-transpeptidase [Chthoniobacterales bacterium]
MSIEARMFRSSALGLALFLAIAPAYAKSIPAPTLNTRIIISVRDQKLMLMENGAVTATYPVSTSKYGLGDAWGSLATPLGLLQVAQKIGDTAPIGAVFHNRRWTGEILRPNTPGRDPVMTRIIWLRGLQIANEHAFRRCIYIHGTNEENLLGRPASFGCIRMRSIDVAALYSQLPLGTPVEIVQDRLPKASNLADPEVYGFDTPASASGLRKDKDTSQIKVASGARAGS